MNLNLDLNLQPLWDMSGKLKRLLELHREDGVLGVAKALGRSLIGSICHYQIQEGRGRIIAEQDPVMSPREDERNLAIECVIIGPGDSLVPFAAEFSLPFRDSFDSLKQRLDQGCILILARRPVDGGSSQEIVGYSIMECGGFSAAGIKGKISPDILFVHFTEVTPKYRGQRIAERITRARNAYCRDRGIKKSCTAHTTGNTSSERAFRKFGSSVLCYAVRRSFFRGLFVWHTPWRKIERAIAKLDVEDASEQVEVEVTVEKRHASEPSSTST